MSIVSSIVMGGGSGGPIEGTAILSTGEVGGTKFLREDGDGTSSWHSPLILGSGITTGNTITKTLDDSGGADFSTWVAMLEWLQNNSFNNANIVINVAAGTYTHPDIGFVALHGVGIASLTIVGASAATVTLNCEAEYVFYELIGTALRLEKMTIVSKHDDDAGGGTFITGYASRVSCISCTFKEWYEILSLSAGWCYVLNSTINNTVYSAGYGIDLYGCHGWIQSLTVTDANEGYPIYVTDGGHLQVSGTITINNADNAFYAENGGRILLKSAPTITNSGSGGYNIPLNTIMGDGSYISNGGPLVLAT